MRLSEIPKIQIRQMILKIKISRIIRLVINHLRKGDFHLYLARELIRGLTVNGLIPLSHVDVGHSADAPTVPDAGSGTLRSGGKLPLAARLHERNV